MTKENNKQIIKNTIFLYTRMLLNMIIAFYTSRIILQSLGVIDYGIYNIVGGVVSMFTFLNTTLAGATSRFLTYELGKNNLNKLHKTFYTSMGIHLFLGIIIIILAETIGLWFVNYKLNIPIDRLNAALIVYQLSILTCFINIIQVPFNASIISHEKMGFYAYMGIFDSIAKLAIAYLLFKSAHDRLIILGIFTLFISFISYIIHALYCCKQFKECNMNYSIDIKTAKPIIKFSGWDLYGNLSVMARSQGINILQNLFFGPIVNASTGIANTVLNGVMGFAENFLTAFKPQIIKQYALNNFNKFFNLVIYSSKYSFLLLYIITIPLILETDFILNFWLEDVPKYADIFCKLSLINNLISILYRPIIISIGATGNVKKVSIVNGTIYLLVLPITYILLTKGCSPITPFVLNIILLLIGHSIFSLKIIKNLIPQFNIYRFFKESIVNSAITCILSLPIPMILIYTIPYGYIRFFIVSTTSCLITVLITYYIIMNDKEKNFTLNLCKQFIKKITPNLINERTN